MRPLALALLALAAAGQDSPPANAPQEPPSRALSLELCASPRLAGTTGSLRGARVVAKHLEAAGWKVEFDEREVLLSLPRRLEFAIFPERAVSERLVQRVERFDPDAIPPGDVPAYNAWSASAKVRARVVDVGFGLREDYERLAAAGVDVRGCIALARYGRAYRGVKVDLAAQFGCVGCLLFNEASGDGGEKGPVWPEGPWKPDTVAQRGSISPLASTPGDPSTPGFPSPPPGVSESRRLSGAALDSVLPKIPCLPIGMRDVRTIQARLAHVEMPVAQKAGADAGAADAAAPATLAQPIGPGPVEVELALDVPRDLRTIRNVIARLEGRDSKLVIAGSHRDAWVRGAHDSGSGCVALIRAAQRLGERARAGWKPEHTLVLGFWDAEEFGLIGSTEWGEAHAAELARDALVYLNADAAVSGTHFGASGAPGMLAALKRTLARVPSVNRELDPPAANLWDEWCAGAAEKSPKLGLPGSGSDFAVFLHHLNVPVIEVGFGGNPGGQYHTEFDDVPMIERFLDPGWVGHEALGATIAELLGDLADAREDVLDAAEASLTMAEKARASADWLAAERCERLARAFDELAAAANGRGARAALDATRFYSALALDSGIPARAWFRNQLWAPGVESGYGFETFPCLRAAARESDEALERETAALIARIDALRSSWSPSPEARAPEPSAAGGGR